MKVLYTASGGREGVVRSSDGALDPALSMPEELGGSGRPGTTNPEQLFAAGYAACFENALSRAAREAKVTIDASAVTARVGIGRKENTRFGLAVELDVSLPSLERGEAEALARRAHEEIRPCSNATRGNVEVQVRVV